MASTEPNVSNPPVPIVAIVVLLTKFIATDGLKAISPAEPVSTMVSLLLLDCAERVNLPALVKFTLSCTEASERLSVLSKAKAMPTPTLG